MAHNNIDEKEHKQLMTKLAIEILRKEFNSLSISSSLCITQGFHAEAETIARAMQFIDKAARQLTERREAE